MSMKFNTGLPRSPSRNSEKANRIAKNRTCNISPSANAPTIVEGTIFIRNSMVLCCPALVV